MTFKLIRMAGLDPKKPALLLRLALMSNYVRKDVRLDVLVQHHWHNQHQNILVVTL